MREHLICLAELLSQYLRDRPEDMENVLVPNRIIDGRLFLARNQDAGLAQDGQMLRKPRLFDAQPLDHRADGGFLVLQIFDDLESDGVRERLKEIRFDLEDEFLIV